MRRAAPDDDAAARKRPRPVENQLETEGYVVITMFDPDKVPTLRRELDETLASFPEYAEPQELEGGPPLVCGGFGALGNPGSFHNPWARKMRRKAWETVLSRRAIPVPGGFKLVQVFDRIMVRKRCQVPASETWHQDLPEGGKLAPGEAHYGGWIALDHQQFSCIPKTHHAETSGSGFSKVADVDGRRRRVVEIRAGEMLIFNAQLYHEVVGAPHEGTIARLFTSFCVLSSASGAPEVAHVVEDQGVPPLKSGQMPVMVPRMYLNFLRRNEGRIRALAEKMVPAATTTHRIGPKSKYRPGETVTLPGNGTRPMKSLKDMGLPLYEPYTEQDLAALSPRTNPYDE